MKTKTIRVSIFEYLQVRSERTVETHFQSFVIIATMVLSGPPLPRAVCGLPDVRGQSLRNGLSPGNV